MGGTSCFQVASSDIQHEAVDLVCLWALPWPLRRPNPRPRLTLTPFSTAITDTLVPTPITDITDILPTHVTTDTEDTTGTHIPMATDTTGESVKHLKMSQPLQSKSVMPRPNPRLTPTTSTAATTAIIFIPTPMATMAASATTTLPTLTLP